MKNKHVDTNIAFRKKFNFKSFPANLFDAHIKKSIPLFNEFHFLTKEVFKHFVSDDTHVYDLGCSTGKFIKSLSKINKNKNVKFIGIDNVKNMINFAKKYNSAKDIQYQNDDIRKVRFKKSNLIICLFTLQFIKNKKDRLNILKKIYSSLNVGGAFVLAEKIYHENRFFEEIVQSSYFSWKKLNKFSKDEISQKTKLLKGVLLPMTSKENHQMIKKSGFNNINTLLRHTVFELYISIK